MRVDSAFIKGLFNKLPVFNKKAGIHHNGEDNNYPELVDALTTNSVTALRCSRLLASYLTGKGFEGDLNKVAVHPDKGITLLRFLQDVSKSVADHNGVFVHVNWNAAYEIKDMTVLPFSDCRVGRKDSNRYNGQILVCEDWSDSKSVKKAEKVHVYNPNPKVIDKQVTAAGGWNKYNGQILFVHTDQYTYPLANLHPCLEDADSEKQASVYKNKSLRKGFFGKMLCVTKPMVDDNLEPDEDDYKKQHDAREAFRNTLKEFIGAENVDGIMHFELEADSDDINDNILFKQIDSNIDDKLFAHTESSVSDNIRMCYYNVPAPLIRTQDGKMFGSSGESIKAMKVFFQDQTQDPRQFVEEIINRLMKNHRNKHEDLKIIPLIKIDTDGTNQ